MLTINFTLLRGFTLELSVEQKLKLELLRRSLPKMSTEELKQEIINNLALLMVREAQFKKEFLEHVL